MAKNTVIINGVTIESDSEDIRITGSEVFIGGKKVANLPDQTATIKWEGDLASLQCDKSVQCMGNINGNVQAGGSVNCLKVDGNVHAEGSVNCDDVGHDVNAGGSVSCDNVRGSVKAGGSVSRG